MTESRHDLETLWRDRLEIAQAHYRMIKARLGTAMAEHGDGKTPSPDGTFAVRRSLKAETDALREYRRVLSIFTDLTVFGKMPPEE
jgi:hypothetical protein